MNKNNSKEKTMGIFVKVNEEEEEIIKKLKNKHSVNISGFIRNALINYYHKLQEIDEIK